MNDVNADRRRFAPPAQRNREPIAQVLQTVLPGHGAVLTIAEGSGEHAVHFAKEFPHLVFQPSDPDAGALASIAAWTDHEGLENIAPPLALDASAEDWPVDEMAAVLCINMIHISPWAATEGLMRGAAHVLPKGGPLYLYGPYRRNGKQTSQSNEQFEGWLKSLSPAYGVRDLADVADCAARNGFGAPEVIDMPANNFSVIFRKG